RRGAAAASARRVRVAAAAHRADRHALRSCAARHRPRAALEDRARDHADALAAALFIHFLNSAYQDGQAEPRYPEWLKLALRVAVFALPVYAALCAYSLGLRVAQHG